MLGDIFIIGLTLYALTYIIRYTDGPFDICKMFRVACGIHYIEELDVDGYAVHIVEEIPEDNMLAKLVGCWWCLSTWISIMLVVLWDVTYNVELATVLFYWFATVGVAGFLQEMTD